MKINISYKCPACLATVDVWKSPPIYDHINGKIMHCGCKTEKK